MCRRTHAFFFLLLIAVQRVSAAAVWELYSENLGTTREELVSSQTRLRLEADGSEGKSIVPYLTGGFDALTQGSGAYSLDSSSHAYAGLGIRVPLQFLQMRVETRFRAPILNAPNFTLVDFRSLLVYGDFVEISERDPVFAFFEPYGELLFTSSDSNNLIFSGYTRVGVRVPVEKSAFDLYAEPFVTVDSRGHAYNNRADVKLASRFQIPLSTLSLSLVVSHQWNTYFAVKEANPFADRLNGWRFMAILGGLL